MRAYDDSKPDVTTPHTHGIHPLGANDEHTLLPNMAMEPEASVDGIISHRISRPNMSADGITPAIYLQILRFSIEERGICLNYK
jgi:hypothetical protein